MERSNRDRVYPYIYKKLVYTHESAKFLIEADWYETDDDLPEPFIEFKVDNGIMTREASTIALDYFGREYDVDFAFDESHMMIRIKRD